MTSGRVLALISAVDGRGSDADRMRHLADLASLAVTVDALVEAAGPAGDGNESGDWEAVFHAVYGGAIAKEQERLFAELHLVMPEFYDPDTTYGADASAWIEAFRSVVRPLIETVSGWGADPVLSSIGEDLAALETRAREAPHGETAAVHIARARAAIGVFAAN